MDYKALAKDVFQVYTTKALAEQAELVMRLYAPNAVFSDNITYVSTAKEIALMFKGLAIMFPTVDVQVHDVVNTQGDDGATTVRNHGGECLSRGFCRQTCTVCGPISADSSNTRSFSPSTPIHPHHPPSGERQKHADVLMQGHDGPHGWQGGQN